MDLGQAVDEWGTVAKGINNGKSYIRFSKVQFFRPEAVAAEYSSTDGDTGLVQAVVFDVNPHPRPALPFHSILSSRRCSHVHRSFPLERDAPHDDAEGILQVLLVHFARRVRLEGTVQLQVAAQSALSQYSPPSSSARGGTALTEKGGLK